MSQRIVILCVFTLFMASCKPTAPSLTSPSPSSPTPIINTPNSQVPLVSSSPGSQTHQLITAANAESIHLLNTLQIPGFKESTLSQCSISFSPEGKYLSGVCYENTIPIWDAQNGQLLLSLESFPSHEVAVAFSPEGNQIATAGFSKNIRLWDIPSGQLIGTLGNLPSPVWDLAFSPQGDKLASARFDRTSSLNLAESEVIQVWDVPNQESFWVYAKGDDKPLVLSVDFSPDGKTVAYGTFDSVLILDAGSGKLIKSLPIPDHVGDLAFSPDGAMLATASDDQKIRLWSTTDYTLIATLEGHTHYVNGVAFSPDSKLLISGSHDKTVGIWDIQNFLLLKKLEGHESRVLRVAINPSGTLIASISWDGTVRLWSIDSED